MTEKDRLEQGRDAFRRRAWEDARTHLVAAGREGPLHPSDLEKLATAAALLGEDADAVETWTRAHHAWRDRDDPAGAARCAFRLASGLMHRGESARAAGWLARAQRLLEDAPEDCVERGYLLVPAALRSIHEGDLESAEAAYARAAAVGERCGDPDLVALARNGRGRVLIRRGKIREGVELLDEAMVAVEAGEVGPLVAGDVYCSMIEGCHEIFDLRRAREWTAALSRWCEEQSDLALYRGQCLVRRSELLRLQGDWEEALAEAREACERLTRPPGEPAAGAAFYQQAELHRVRGELHAAEETYREASRWGRKPQPGLALLRLGQDRTDDAASSIRRALGEAHGRSGRASLLPAFVEIMLAAGDVEAARDGAEELTGIAATLEAPALRASAAQARGAVRLAEGDADAALEEARKAWALWEEVEAPYEAGRARILVALACRELGDEDGAAMELDAARWIFRRLEARRDLERVDDLTRRAAPREAHGLTPREMDVLRLVATGETNKAIGRKLSISDRTVERHVSNIFRKLGVSSRAGATAHAYEHRLV